MKGAGLGRYARGALVIALTLTAEPSKSQALEELPWFV